MIAYPDYFSEYSFQIESYTETLRAEDTQYDCLRGFVVGHMAEPMDERSPLGMRYDVVSRVI